MLGLLRALIERFDSVKYPHEYPDDMTQSITGNTPYDQHMQNHDHLARYFDISKGYTSFYDVCVFIIVGVFMLMVIREITLQFEEKHKVYMYMCVLLIGICAILY